MEKYDIYLVEDEENLSEVLKAYMQKEGWNVTVFDNGDAAVDAVSDKPHLWVLDIMLPGTDGYQVLKAIKNEEDTPVIFISARDQDLDRVLGLEMGSDDYLSKPIPATRAHYSCKENFKSGLWVKYIRCTKSRTKRIYHDPIGRTIIDTEENNEAVDLTTKEMDLMLLLSAEIGKAFSREKIIEHVWGDNYFGSERAVDDVVRRVRKKMPRIHLETLYGYGYRILSS
ncbi:response regulator transcription factor [Shouchella lehensis]|uniref:Signal transduction response regulator n=1 Tax=Shouchella lehensis G1 TaxID=1246626 RepID=A0A060M045_9BACI|nr:response regulator transcription factor [Shouchella lehensis]AIC93918.1 signal transduction response regulator [Shouchella lehensis G1]